MKWTIGDPRTPDGGRAEALPDALLLALLVMVSCFPYVPGLGLYSDDWAFLWELYGAGPSFGERWDALVQGSFTTRPVHGLVTIGLYSLFQLEPLGYHVANMIVLAVTAVLFYMSLRSLGLPRLLTLAIPLVFALLPHYSTDRFWIAAFQANLSVLLYFLSLYADLRFVRGKGARRWAWKGLGAAAMVGSLLAYEVTGALFLVNVPVLLYAAHARERGPRRPRITPTSVAIASNVALLALVVGFKMTTTVRADLSGGYRYRALRLIREAVPVHFGEYGLALPLKVVRVLRDHADMGGIAASVLIGVVAASYLVRVMRAGEGRFDRGVHWPAVTLTGGILFGAGYAVTLTTWEIGFHATGSNNRTAIAAAIGVAWVFVGAVGWLSSLLPTERARRAAFAGLTGVLVVSNVLIINAIAGFWTRADHLQDEIVTGLRQEVSDLPSGTTLLLDGVCPFEGPAMVFVTDWDVTAMLRLAYDDPSLHGDVIKLDTQVTAEGIRTQFFGDVINVYPYGDRLLAYHVGTGDTYALDDADAARRYLEEVGGPARGPCPAYTDGDGAPIF